MVTPAGNNISETPLIEGLYLQATLYHKLVKLLIILLNKFFLLLFKNILLFEDKFVLQLFKRLYPNSIYSYEVEISRNIKYG